jgi:hypothetical protein
MVCFSSPFPDILLPVGLERSLERVFVEISQQTRLFNHHRPIRTFGSPTIASPIVVLCIRLGFYDFGDAHNDGCGSVDSAYDLRNRNTTASS